jgi:hypothetical protein
MVCQKFKDVPDVDRVQLQARLLHVMQSDDELFEDSMNLIAKGYERGLFTNVKFGNESLNY